MVLLMAQSEPKPVAVQDETSEPQSQGKVKKERFVKPTKKVNQHAKRQRQIATQKFMSHASESSAELGDFNDISNIGIEFVDKLPSDGFRCKDIICDADYMFVSGGTTIHMYDEETLGILESWEYPKNISVMCLNPEKTILYAAAAKGERVYCRNISNGELFKTMAASMVKGEKTIKEITAIDCSNGWLFVGGRGHQFVYGFDVNSDDRRPVKKFKHGEDVTAVNVHDDFLFTSGKRGRTSLFHVGDETFIKMYRDTQAITSAGLIANGLHLITTGDQGLVSEWDTVTGDKVRFFKINQKIDSIVVSKRRQYAICLAGHKIFGINLTTNTVEKVIEDHDELVHLGLHGNTLFAGGIGGQLSLFNITFNEA